MERPLKTGRIAQSSCTILLPCKNETNSVRPKAFHIDPQHNVFFPPFKFRCFWWEPTLLTGTADVLLVAGIQKAVWMDGIERSATPLDPSPVQVPSNPEFRQATVRGALQSPSPRLGLSWMPAAQHRMNTFFLLHSGYRVGWLGSSQRQNTLPKSIETLYTV